MHIHLHFDGWLMFLGGRMRWTMGVKTREVGWRDLFRGWPVPAGMVHGATVTGAFGLFLNLERWTCPPTSAATDFVPQA